MVVRDPGGPCEHKRQVVILNPTCYSYPVTIHQGCIHNERVALYNRHLTRISIGKYDRGYMHACFRDVASTIELDSVERLSPRSVVNHYVGAKRAVYERALDGLHTFNHAHSTLSMFVKPERMRLDKIKTKPPRAIQYRNPKFNLLLACYLKPFEEAFYAYRGKQPAPIIAKGRNSYERALDIKTLWDDFSDPVVWCLDHKEFDAHVTEDLLRAEHKAYLKAYKGNTGQLHRLLRWQLRNKGYSRNGIVYKVRGTRASGDYNTGLGNSLINYYLLRSWLNKHGVCGHIYLDGDDSLVFMERKDAKLMSFEHFNKCGMETTHELVYQLEEAEFCQCRWVNGEPPNMVRNPYRVASHAAVAIRATNHQRVREAIGLSEEANNQGCPVNQALALALQQGVRPLFDHETWLKYMLAGKRRAGPITDEARVSFAIAWGIDLPEQSSIEKHLSQPCVNCFANSLLHATHCDFFCFKHANAEAIRLKYSLGSYRTASGEYSWAISSDLLD